MHLYSVKITTCYKNITHLILCSIQISSNCTIENFSHSVETLLHFHAWTIGPWRKWNSAYTVWILELPYTTTSTSQSHAVPWQHTYNMWRKQWSFDVPCSVKAMESLFFFIFFVCFLTAVQFSDKMMKRLKSGYNSCTLELGWRHFSQNHGQYSYVHHHQQSSLFL